MLKDRLEENYERLKKTGLTKKTEAFRVYDNEIENYPCTIDLYADYAYISLFEKKDIDMEDLTEAVKYSLKNVFNITGEKCVIRIRRRQSDGSQYEKLGSSGSTFTVKELGVEYYINLWDYLDTGLFIDHRKTREIFAGLVKGKKRVLNLFSYTGAFSLIAAKNGVEFTTSVDMSNTYTEWAQENILLNGFNHYKHIAIRDNVFFFLENIRTKNWKFDFIVIDPPTMSRSKKMERKFDIQRDHSELINMSLPYLERGGKILFSTNFRKFRLDVDNIDADNIKDITEDTIPEDFKDKKIHKAWIIS